MALWPCRAVVGRIRNGSWSGSGLLQKGDRDVWTTALDLGCGSGRLLFPFLQAGLEVDGCDYSEDMVAVCQERAEREGLSPGLYAQAMHELDLPRRYRTIYACDVIGLGGERRLTMQAMQRCYEHLRARGRVRIQPYGAMERSPAWLSRLPEYRRVYPMSGRKSSERQLLPDGTELEEATRTVAVDPVENVATRQIGCGCGMKEI